MKTYNTYQEAKIDNPNSDIYEREKGVFATESLHREPCNPADYCMSLESFLASGKRAFRGDIIADKDGKAMIVEAESIVNTPLENDCEVYVIKAKALESPAHEWANGDECVYNNMGYIFVGMTPTFNDVSCIIFNPKNGIEHVSVRALSKPETPEKKLEREELEAAFDLWEKTKSDDDSDWSDMPIYFQGYILTAVKTRGYRKEAKS